MIHKWLAGAALAATLAGAAHAQAPEMVRAQDPQSVIQALQAGGYAATLGADQAGDPLITSGTGGTTFRVFFYNCTDNRACATVQFHVGYEVKTPLTLDKINEWNRTQRFARAYLDSESDPILEMDVDLDDGGLSRALFLDNLEFWQALIATFERHIGFRQ